MRKGTRILKENCNMHVFVQIQLFRNAEVTCITEGNQIPTIGFVTLHYIRFMLLLSEPLK